MLLHIFFRAWRPSDHTDPFFPMHMTRFNPSCSLRIPVSAAALAIVLALTACSRQQPAFAMPQAEVTAITVKPESLAIDSELPGRTSAYQSSDVRPQVGGILRKRLFSEGADVKAGQVLYEIDPATYQAAYDTAVVIRAEHQCMSFRGVKDDATSMVTSVMRGFFRDDSKARTELMTILQGQGF